MATKVRVPTEIWSDPAWLGLTQAAQVLAIVCFALGRAGSVTNARIERKTGWELAFIENTRSEIEGSPYAIWLVGAVKRRRLPKSVVSAVKERAGYRCGACGSTEDLQIDHIHPVRHGGSDDMDNLQTLCGTHNREKGAQLNWVMT